MCSVLHALQILPQILTKTQKGRFLALFSYEKTEAQPSNLTYPRSHSEVVGGPEFNPRPFLSPGSGLFLQPQWWSNYVVTKGLFSEQIQIEDK